MLQRGCHLTDCDRVLQKTEGKANTQQAVACRAQAAGIAEDHHTIYATH